MAKCQATLTSLGLVAVTRPEKRIASQNDGHSSSSSSTSLNSSSSSNSVSNRKSISELSCPYDIGKVYDISHFLTDLEK